MIIGIGSDLIDIDRIETLLNRFQKRFLTRVFSMLEQKAASLQKHPAAFLAKRFAAKEACLKALGLGLRDGIHWTDIEITNDSLGKPFMQLTGKAAEHLAAFGKTSIYVTLSDTPHLALAFVVIEKTEVKTP